MDTLRSTVSEHGAPMWISSPIVMPVTISTARPFIKLSHRDYCDVSLVTCHCRSKAAYLL